MKRISKKYYTIFNVALYARSRRVSWRLLGLALKVPEGWAWRRMVIAGWKEWVSNEGGRSECECSCVCSCVCAHKQRGTHPDDIRFLVVGGLALLPFPNRHSLEFWWCWLPYHRHRPREGMTTIVDGRHGGTTREAEGVAAVSPLEVEHGEVAGTLV